MKYFIKLILIAFVMLSLVACESSSSGGNSVYTGSNNLRVLVSNEYESIISEIPGLSYTVMSDIDMVRELNANKNYDAVWISNSMWLYMLNGISVSESNSIAISPVVFALNKEKAEQLGLVDKEVTNEDIVNLIINKEINFSMTSAARTNTGATAYLSFLNTFCGNPEVLTAQMIDAPNVEEWMTKIFKNVNRNTGSESFLFDLYDKDECNALIATEASIISYNKKHPDKALYMLYPTDGMGIADSTFSFIGKSEQKEKYEEVRDTLLSKNTQKKMYDMGYRTWYGGRAEINDETFNKDWGVDVSKIINVSSYPSKEVITKAINNYIESFRKNSLTIFVLDYSGSMDGSGYKQLQSAMEYICNSEEAAEEFLQFSPKDYLNAIYFSYSNIDDTLLYEGSDAAKVYGELKDVDPLGKTPLYEAIKVAEKNAYELVNQMNLQEYSVSIVAMTDGVPTDSSKNLEGTQWEGMFPVYTIAFGDANLKILQDIANRSGGKAFDGRTNLLDAFREIRGYN